MPSKKVFIAGYDDGHGFKIIDPATGALIRQVQGSWWTDRVQNVVVEGQNLWCLDTDSSLVRADLDGVVKSKVDIGYSGTADSGEDEFWPMFVTGSHIYHLHNVNTNNPNPGGGLAQGDPQPADSQIFYIIKRNKLTLAVVSETKLDHANLGDSPGNQAYFDGKVRCWMTDGFWVQCESGPKAGFLIKVGFDGVPTGAEIDMTGVSFNGNQKIWDGATKLIYLDINYTGDYGSTHSISLTSGSVFDFTGAGSATAITPWGPTTTGYYSDTWGLMTTTERAPRITGTVLDFVIHAQNHAWVGGPHDGMTGAFIQQSFNYLDGTGLVESAPVWLNVWDKPANNSAGLAECLAPYDADRFFMIDERYGVWLVNFTTGAVDYTTGYNFMQGYSSDATEIDSGWMVTLPYYTLTGTVTDGGTPVSGRDVFVYDQQTGTYIGKAITNGSGVYSMTVFTTSDKFVVCPSTDGTKNFMVNAHLTPA